MRYAAPMYQPGGKASQPGQSTADCNSSQVDNRLFTNDLAEALSGLEPAPSLPTTTKNDNCPDGPDGWWCHWMS
jgi:hypothetical protein